MTKIGLLSDTHDYLDAQIFKYFIGCDEIWHAGDVGSAEIIDELESVAPVRAVYGNIDGQDVRASCPKHLHWNNQDLNFWMTHIGGSIDNYSADIRKKLNEEPPDVFICGHSHILQVGRAKQYNNMIHVNPGAAGKYGPQNYRTCVRFDIEDRAIKNMEVIHL